MAKKETKDARGRKKNLSTTAKVMKYSKGLGFEKYNFLYTIPAINQFAVIKNGWDLDIIDIAIYYAIENFILSDKAKKYIDKNNVSWYWVDESKILKDMPLLPINSNMPVFNRIKKLIKYNLIERNSENIHSKLKLIRLGSDFELLHRNYAKE